MWQISADQRWINPVVIASPTRIAVAFYQQWTSGQFLRDLIVSLLELATGFGASIIVGVMTGIFMGLNRDVEYVLDPFIWFLYSTPLIALYPLIVVWLGFGFATVVAVTFFLTFTAIVVNTLAGVRSVDPTLVSVIRVFGGNQRDVIFKVVLPASIPLVMAGIRIGLSRALIGVVLGEMFGASAGLGFRMTFYGEQLRTADVFVPLVAFMFIGIVLTQLATSAEAWLQTWKA